jgi:flavodoxin
VLVNALVVYFSSYGNTRNVAEAISQGLKSIQSVRTMALDEVTVSDMGGSDLVVMGCPTHRMNLPEAVRALFDTFPKRVLRDIPVAAFDTSYKMSPWLARFTAASKLDKRLRKLGGKRIAPPETFLVVDREGPLYDGELERAETWARFILKKLDQ